jgi:acetylornithine deacetylase
MAPTLLPDRELLRRLVAFDSTSHRSNLPLIDFIADYLDRPGVRLERIPSPAGDKAALLAFVGPESETDARNGLVLSGHTDVVPPGEGWDADPFVLTETSNRLIARGACDMKGFLALAINAAARAADRRLGAPLVLVFTYDEEVGTLGARHIAETWPRERKLPRRAIIGEPTALQPVRMHKGHLRLRLVLHGRSAHSGYPHLGINAIERGGAAIVALARLRNELQHERPAMAEHFPDVPFVALNVGQVTGGVAVNVVPERCVLDVGIRLLPGMPSAPFVDRARQSVALAVGPDAFDLTVLSESPPMALDGDADHYRMLAVESAADEAPGVSFATDAGWLQTIGLACVVWGPGSIAVAHRPNEYLPIAEFERAGRIVERAVHRFCGSVGRE